MFQFWLVDVGWLGLVYWFRWYMAQKHTWITYKLSRNAINCQLNDTIYTSIIFKRQRCDRVNLVRITRDAKKCSVCVFMPNQLCLILKIKGMTWNFSAGKKYWTEFCISLQWFKHFCQKLWNCKNFVNLNRLHRVLIANVMNGLCDVWLYIVECLGKLEQMYSIQQAQNFPLSIYYIKF